tara:strand:- start:1589 stop:1855 length:267 start_codon:yes stop_codon:yes gene_type:complete
MATWRSLLSSCFSVFPAKGGQNPRTCPVAMSVSNVKSEWKSSRESQIANHCGPSILSRFPNTKVINFKIGKRKKAHHNEWAWLVDIDA